MQDIFDNLYYICLEKIETMSKFTNSYGLTILNMKNINNLNRPTASRKTGTNFLDKRKSGMDKFTTESYTH